MTTVSTTHRKFCLRAIEKEVATWRARLLQEAASDDNLLTVIAGAFRLQWSIARWSAVRLSLHLKPNLNVEICGP
jgi:hypothetical protein